jgi:hypothetical protein
MTLMLVEPLTPESEAAMVSATSIAGGSNHGCFSADVQLESGSYAARLATGIAH